MLALSAFKFESIYKLSWKWKSLWSTKETTGRELKSTSSMYAQKLTTYHTHSEIVWDLPSWFSLCLDSLLRKRTTCGTNPEKKTCSVNRGKTARNWISESFCNGFYMKSVCTRMRESGMEVKATAQNVKLYTELARTLQRYFMRRERKKRRWKDE